MNLKKQFFWIFFIAVSACLSPNNTEQQSSYETDTVVEQPTEPVPMEVSNTEDDSPKQWKYPFSNTVYLFTSDFDLNNCKPMRRCDCCTSETFFVDSVKYYDASYCEGSTYYTAGTYSVEGNEIFMQSTALVEIVFDYDTYELTGDTTFMELKGESYFEIDSCNSKVMLISAPDPPASYGILSAQPLQVLSNEIIEMLNEGKD